MALLEVNNLRTSFFTEKGEIPVLRGVSFSLDEGKALGIVGESGSGKSITVYSILGLLQKPGQVVGGSVKLRGKELIGTAESDMRKIRGNKISIIFQDPMTSLNPTKTVGDQIAEAILLHTERTHKEAKERTLELLKLVNISDSEKRMRQYPFELSGGMRQRVMIAMALACEPDILIADEPTTALDVTIQAEILDLISSLKESLRMAVIMITHDLGVVARTCDDVVVMYAGEICESGSVTDIFYNPKHEYTKGLLRSVPDADSESGRLHAIRGSVGELHSGIVGCPFMPRCDKAMKICKERNADTMSFGNKHIARCWENQRKLYEHRLRHDNAED